MTRISAQELYDNKDVIQQIKILKDSVSTADTKSTSALEAVDKASSDASQALSVANTAKATTDALQPIVDGHTASIEAVEIEAQQALTDANDAFDQASITQTAEAATITMTRGTGFQEQIPFPIASSVQTGMMNAQTYAGIVNLTARVDKLEASKTVYYVTFSSTSPTDSELTSLFTTVSGRAPVAGDYLTDIAKSLTYGYNGTNWIKVETSADIPMFTSETPGLIKGSTTDGTVAAEADGTGSVNGWDNVKTTLTNHTESIGTIQSSLSTVEGELTNKQNAIQTVVVTLNSSEWNTDTLSITVTVDFMTPDLMVWVAPVPASFVDYGDSRVYASEQGAGTLTFKCESIPGANLQVNVGGA